MTLEDLLGGVVPADHRVRLMAGIALAITEKGYAATTIADVVRHARVSKRTFYEHFADKEACFLAAYSAASDGLLGVIAEAARGGGSFEERLEAAAHAYLSQLSAQPAATRTFLVEIQAAGPRGLELRRRVHQRFAGLIQALVEDARRERGDLRPLTGPLATAIVGGIDELLLQAAEEGRAAELTELAGTATTLIRAVVTAPGD